MLHRARRNSSAAVELRAAARCRWPLRSKTAGVADCTARRTRGGRALAAVSWVLLVASGCGAFRQNLRNEFVTFRGTWHCAKKKCKQPQMERATRGHREGEVNISHAKLNPRAAMVFYPGKPVNTLTATASCEGRTQAVPANRLKKPGRHKIGGQPDSWIVIIDPSDYSFSESCETIRVLTTATWDDGKSYEERGGIQIER